MDGASLYEYVQSNPTGLIDPLGLDAWAFIGGFFIVSDNEMAAENARVAQANVDRLAANGQHALAIRIANEAGVTVPATSRQWSIDQQYERAANSGEAKLTGSNPGGVAVVQAVAETAVRINPISDVAEAVTGQDIITGEELSAGQRALAVISSVPGGVVAGAVDKAADAVKIARTAERTAAAAAAAAKKAAKCADAAEPVRYFKTFDQLKRALGPAGKNMAWHHIVEQSQVGRFGAEAIQNTDNVIAISAELNQKLNALYSGIHMDITGSGTQTIRQWLRTQTYEQARTFGLQALENVRNGIW